MKKTLFALVLFCAIINVNAQNNEASADTIPGPWKTGGTTNLTFSQAYFENWSAGGENSVALNARINIFANYSLNNWSWDNSLDIAYGQSKQGNVDWRKNDDLFEINTKAGYKVSDVMYVSGIVQFKTQLTNGTDYGDNSLTSQFLNPAYLNFGVGIDYKPNDFLTVYISPVNSKITFVTDTTFSTRYGLEKGEKLNYDFGLYLKSKFQKDLTDNINLMTRLDLFADYGDLGIDKIDVNWEVLLSMKIWKALAFNINTNLLYDNDIKQPNNDGELEALWQFKEVLGIGFTYKF